MTPLTKSYNLEDFTRSATAKRLGIDNTPSKDIIDRLENLAGVLEHLQGVLGLTLTISSGYRCPALNKAVGGQPTSGHAKGYAIDLQTSISPEELADRILLEGLEFDQMIIESLGGKKWLHLSIDPRFRRMLLQIHK